MQYVSGRKINQDFGVPGITTNDTVVNVDGRIAVGIGTTARGVATANIDTNTLRIRDTVIDANGFGGELGYFLTKDNKGLTWVEVSPITSNSIFVADNGDILGVSSFTGLNIISDQLIGVTTNGINSSFADITIDSRWFRDRTPGGGGGIYTTGTVGIGLTQPRLGPVGILTDVKLDVLGDAIFSGIISASSFIGEFNVDTEDLNVSGIASFTGETDNVIGDTNTGILQIDGGVGIDKNVSIGSSLDVNNLLTVGGAVTIGNGVVSATTGDFINLELDNLNVTGLSTFGDTARFDGPVNIFDDLFVSGNISVGGTGVTLDTETIRIEGKELLIGFTTTITPNDTTANAAGIAVASTEGYFLADLQVPGINTTPNTYKQFKWFKNGTFVGQGTDAFISNQPISIGGTQIGNGQLFAVGNNINFTEDKITAPTFVGNLTGTASTARDVIGGIGSLTSLSVSGISTLGTVKISAGIVTATSGIVTYFGEFNGPLTGTASTASFATTAFTLDGRVESEFNVAFAQTAGIATNVIGGIGSLTSLSVSGISTLGTVKISAGIVTATSGIVTYFGEFNGPLTGTASTASFATTAFTLNDRVESEFNVAFAQTAGIATNVIGGIASVTQLNVTGISTLGTVKISAGVVTATTGIVTYYGDGSNLEGIISGVGIQSSGTVIGTGFTTLNFIGTGNTFVGVGNTINISINSSQFAGFAQTAGIATNLAGGAGGSIPYQSAADTTEFLSNGTVGQVLVSNGGTSGPSWANAASTGAIDRITIQDEDSIVGSAGSVSILNFKGDGVSATASGSISTITINQSVNGSGGIASTARDVIGGIASVTSLSVSGISTLGFATVSNLYVSGVTTSIGGFAGNLTGTASTASFATTAFNLNGVAESDLNVAFAQTAGLSTETTKLQTPRNFEITGDVVASAISFDGTGNVSFAATIQPNSVGLGTDTTGDYVKSITGTSNEIEVTSGSGEGSTPQIGLPNDVTITQDLTVNRDVQIVRNLNVDGNITIGGTSATLFTQTLTVADSDLILGVRTDALGNDISTDNTANHGGIAIASTEGTPLITLTNPGAGETLPSTYKKIMWFKSGSFSGLGTDAWLSNYAIGIGSTQFPTGTRLAAGNVQITENDLSVVRNINASGIVTASGGFVGNLTGTASTASFATTAFNLNGVVESDLNVATATTATNLANAANITTGTINADRLTGSYGISITGAASTASFATTAFNLNGVVESDLNVATAVTATNLANAANITTGTINADRLTGSYGISITGTASTASFATTAFSLNGIVESDLNVAFAQTAGIATNVIGGIGSLTSLSVSNTGISTLGVVKISAGIITNTSAGVAVTVFGDLIGTASTASFATTAFNLNNKPEGDLNVAFATTAGIATYTSEWIIAANGSSDYRFTGPGFTGSENDPTIYLTRGEQYKFTNNLGIHPFQIQRQFQNTGGTAYNDGIVNNGVSNGTLTWNVRMDAPDILYYQCTSHTNMSGKIYIVNAGIASDVNLFTTGISTLGTVKISAGIVTATSGIVTYYGDGQYLENINPGITSISISSNVENQSQYITYATSIGNTTGLGVTTGGLTFNPSTRRMGIGAASPVVDLHILSGTSSFSPVTNFDKLVIENQNGGQGAVLQLVSPNKSEIGFSDANRNAGLLSYDHNNNSMHFDSNNTDRVTIDSDGHIGIGTLTPTNAVATSNTKILNVGVVTANFLYGSGANLTNLTGASAATYGDASNVAQVVVDANGRITGISNVAISGGGGGDTYQFNTGVTSSISLAATGLGITALTLPSTAGKQYTIYSINASNVATGNTEVNFIGAFDFSGGERSYFAYNLPVPTGLSIEVLKQPQILNPSDRITIRSTDFDRNGADDIIDVYITYKEETSSDYFGVGIGTVGIAVTTNIGIYTSSTYPSVVQSIRLANRTDDGGKPISVAINNGIRTTYLIDNLIVPKYASIELLETPKRLSTNDVIEVQVDETECIDIQISGKKITS